MEKNRIGIGLPVIYDLAWLIIDRNGNIYDSKSIIIQETFFNEEMFNTGYYADKRHLYMKGIMNGDFKIMTYQQALQELESDADTVDFLCAYNCCFDFKKAIPFTKKYLNGAYTQKQLHAIMDNIARNGDNPNKREDWLLPTAKILDNEYPLFDIWGEAVTKICDTKGYRKWCKDNDLCTASGKYYRTSAEAVYSYLIKDIDYQEKHTALEDCYIESEILQRCIKKKAIQKPLENITAFVFRKLGRFDLEMEGAE
jgi:hypothetical protein